MAGFGDRESNELGTTPVSAASAAQPAAAPVPPSMPERLRSDSSARAASLETHPEVRRLNNPRPEETHPAVHAVYNPSSSAPSQHEPGSHGRTQSRQGIAPVKSGMRQIGKSGNDITRDRDRLKKRNSLIRTKKIEIPNYEQLDPKDAMRLLKELPTAGQVRTAEGRERTNLFALRRITPTLVPVTDVQNARKVYDKCAVANRTEVREKCGTELDNWIATARRAHPAPST